MAEQETSETERQLLRMANGVRMAMQATPAPVAQSARVPVGFRGKARLYYYPPRDGARLATPLVLFPYLGISHPYIFDLRPGESFAEYLAEQGVPFYLCDWGVFGPEDRNLGIETVVSDIIPSLLRQALDHAGAPAATLFGYCMGVPMTSLALARDPSLPVRNLLAMVGPIDFAQGEFPKQTAEDVFDVDAIVETFDMMPAEFVRSGFKMLNPTGDLQQAANLAQNMWNEEWLRGYLAVNRWSSEWLPLPKTFFRQWVRHFYQRNELVGGEFRVLGQRIDLSAITVPTLCISAANDDIVPSGSARALIEVISSEDKSHIELPGGHISVISGRRARGQVWPGLIEWLTAHDG